MLDPQDASNLTGMDLVLDEHQEMLRESARAFVKINGGPAAFRANLAQEAGFDRGRLEAVAADGWFRLLVSPSRKGLGLGLTELALVMEAAGAGLMTEPIAEMAVSAWAISNGRAATGLGQVLTELMEGKRIVVPAIRDSVLPPEHSSGIISTNEHHGYQLTGKTPAVPVPDLVDDYLVNAETQEGTLVFSVRGHGAGLISKVISRKDGITIGKIDFPGVFLVEEALVAGREQGALIATQIYDRVLIGHVAEMLGVMTGAMELTLDYVRTREQFGKAIGSFQVIQHRMVDDSMALEVTRSLLYQTCKAFDEGRGQRAMVAALKAHASEAVLQIAKSAIQLHGAIGFTDEHDAGLFLKRAMGLSVQYGTSSEHRRRFEHLSGEEPQDSHPSKKTKRRPKKRRRGIFSGMSGS